MPTRLLDLELSQPIEDLTQLDGYSSLRATIRWRGTPLGDLNLPIANGTCTAATLLQALLPHYAWAISRQLVLDRLNQFSQQPASLLDATWSLPQLLAHPPLDAVSDPVPALSALTIAACLPERPNDPNGEETIALLEALQQQDYAPTTVLVLEINPADDRVAQQVRAQYPQFVYGTATSDAHARSIAFRQATTDLIGFTTARPDPDWSRQLAIGFAENPQVAALTGLVLPTTLDQPSQIHFEAGYGYGRGFERQWHRLHRSLRWTDLGTMQIGSGINWALRRSLLSESVASAVTESIDLAGFCALLLDGQTILYEPRAIVRYAPPADDAALRSQVSAQTQDFFTYIRAGLRSPLRSQFGLLGLWKLARRLAVWWRSDQSGRQLVRAEWAAARQGLMTKSRLRLAAATANRQPPPRVAAVRAIELAAPLPDFTDIADYQSLRLYVTWQQQPIGTATIEHGGQAVSAAELRQAIANQLTLPLLALPKLDTVATWTEVLQGLEHYFALPDRLPPAVPALPNAVPVSIVITTCDRPQDLRRCLQHVLAQQTDRSVEVIVADNRPASGRTPAVLAEFPTVKLVSESRPGAAYGRNAAIAVSTGEIIVTVDDDVTVPPHWLETLIAPMARSEVAVVTGNVLPLELDTEAQVMFETLKGGLSQGTMPFEVDGNWLASFRSSPPTWNLGVSANSAFRASVFAHPQIGLMSEVLGPGTPAGGAEENHLIYKILRAGYTLVYQPKAYVWHTHRRDLPAFYRQVYGQMKSCTAYHLLLWRQEHDRRGLRQLWLELPRYYRQRLFDRLKGRDQTPWRLLWIELWGLFAGFRAYWQSVKQVQQQGRSAPYIPPSDRSPAIAPPDSPPLVPPLASPPLSPPITHDHF